MSSIPASASGVTAAANPSVSRFNELESEDFIKIIFTELQQQDPFDPNDSSALLEQLNSIRQIESDIQMTSQLESIVMQNQLASAGNLIGNMVQGILPTGDRVAGQVISVVRQGDKVSLELDTGWLMPMENIEVIVDPASIPGHSDPVDESGEAEGSGDSGDAGESEETDESGESGDADDSGESDGSDESDESDESEEGEDGEG